jgi:membrane associated rhomboid family serine protease
MLPIVVQMGKSVLVALLSMPVGTRVILVAHIVFVFVSMLMSHSTFVALFGLQPFSAVFKLQCLSPPRSPLRPSPLAVFRLFTYAFVQLDPLLFVISMLLFIPIGKSIERQLGTVVFIATVLIFTLLQGISIVVYYAAKTSVFGTSEDFFNINVTGFSGVLLSIGVAHANKFVNDDGIQVFGLFRMPYPVYPWLVFLLMCFNPAISLATTLVGLALGYAYVQGLLCLFFPSKDFWLQFEASQLQALVAGNGFIATTPPTPLSGVVSPTTTLSRSTSSRALSVG